MLECLIVGDSIAVGTHQYKQECVAYAKGGINSWQWNKQFGNKTPLQAKTVIISLGSNDHKGVNTEAELLMLRNATKADRVYWILPAGVHPKNNVPVNVIQTIVTKVANEYGDVVIPIKHLQPDGIHPSGTGYKEISKSF